MTYIDRTFIENLMGPSVLSGCLSYGGTPAASTGSVLNQLITSSQGFVDSFMMGAGYSVPVSDSTNNFLGQLVGFKTMESLYIRSNQPVPEAVKTQIATDTNYLILLIQGKVVTPSVPVPTDSAVQGGHSFTDSDAGDAYENIVSVGVLRGSFF